MKAAIVYYSHSGNTRELALEIREQTGGDLVEIQPRDPYPDEYRAVVQQAKRELASDFKPVLEPLVADITSYDTIFVGSPNWCSTIAPPVQTFLSEHDLSGKTVVPFVTHGGGGSARCFTDTAALCPDSTVLEGLAVLGRAGTAGRDMVSAWLAKLGLEG